jgi:hypothetical protein
MADNRFAQLSCAARALKMVGHEGFLVQDDVDEVIRLGGLCCTALVGRSGGGRECNANPSFWAMALALEVLARRHGRVVTDCEARDSLTWERMEAYMHRRYRYESGPPQSRYKKFEQLNRLLFSVHDDGVRSEITREFLPKVVALPMPEGGRGSGARRAAIRRTPRVRTEVSGGLQVKAS